MLKKEILQSMTGLIVCNGRIRDYGFYKPFFDKAGLVICADGGAAHLQKFGVLPHVLLGDFDSISFEDMEYYKSSEVEILKFPVEKDMTDTELAVEMAAQRGCKEIILIGALGTRMDHSISNVFLLKKMLDMGVEGVIADEYNEIRLIDKSIELKRDGDRKVTLLPLSGSVSGVTTKGLYYPLLKATIPIGSTWGVSNEFTGETAGVDIEEGLMLVIESRD